MRALNLPADTDFVKDCYCKACYCCCWATIAISFSIFGYVYVLTRASFHYQSQNLIDLGKNLGFSKKKTFMKIILPAARPSIIAGLSLVAMETLSDFGSVSFFGVSTLTTGIYNAWITYDDLTLANQLSFYLLIFIFVLFILENISRQKAQYHSPSKSGIRSKQKILLRGNKAFLASSTCFLVFFISFISQDCPGSSQDCPGSSQGYPKGSRSGLGTQQG